MRFLTSFATEETARPNVFAIWAKVSRHSSPWAMPFLVSMVMCFAMTSFLSLLDWPRTDGTPVPAHGPGAHCLMRRRGGGREGGRPGDVMSDLSAVGTAARPGQCRESRAARARTRGVDAFDEADSRPKTL